MIEKELKEKKKIKNPRVAQLARALPPRPSDDLETGDVEEVDRDSRVYNGNGSSPSSRTMIGSSDLRKFKNFQVRWKEKLGYQENPYLIRWTILIFGFSIRVHHWIKSDDTRFFHDHSADLISIVLKGHYWNVKPIEPNKEPRAAIKGERGVKPNILPYHVYGIFESWHNFFHPWQSIWFSKAEDQHYLKIPEGGAWTLMLEGRKRHKWGFYVNGHKWRPLRYFHKYGIIQTEDYQ